MDGWSVTQLIDVYKGRLLKNLQIKNRSSSCQCWSLHGFQTQYFICDQFGCKLQLLSIENHVSHSFQAFARRHLKSMCCAIQILAHALSSDRSSIQTCCFAQELIQNMLFCSYYIFLLRDQRLIERLSEAMGIGHSFGRQLLLANSIKIFISHEKKQ